MNSSQSIINVRSIALFVLLIIAGTSSISGQCRSFTINMYKVSLSYTEHTVNPSDEGQRFPGKPIICVISDTSMSIQGIEDSTIMKYEAYDEYGDFICSFCTQKDFIDFIFNSEGTIIIRFVFSDYALIGFHYSAY